MELHGVHKTFHHSHLGEEKHQMLNLNRRLEAYLGRVKLLEEENELLAKEIQALRRSNHGASTRRQGLEEELRQARLAVDAAWRDRIQAEMEVGMVAEELQALDLQRQREAQAQVEAKKKLEQSRKELEEEQRAQIWLREKVMQLEHEMRHLIQTHQEDVAHMEATLTHSRVTMPPTVAQRGNQTANLLQLGEELSQKASAVWQEAAEAYQGQLDQLEESLDQARSRLILVGKEKSESQMKLQALEKEITSAQNVRLHLEKTAAQQGDRYSQEIQQLQEYLEGLEMEKQELGQQIDHLLLENRGLQQQKMSLGLEVATYRALLDSESIKGDVPLSNKPRNISTTDAVFNPRGAKRNYQIQLSTSHKTTSLSSGHVVTGRGPAAISTTPVWSRKPVKLTETSKISTTPAYDPDTTKSATWETPYPKILQDGAIENFRPQEVHEKVTYAEPLSPPNEQKSETTSGDKDGEEDDVGVGLPEERPVVESAVSYQVESGLSKEALFNHELSQHQFTPNLTPYHVRMTEETCGFSDESDNDVPFEKPVEKEDKQDPLAPVDVWIEKEFTSKEVEHVQQETTDSETEAILEPNFESRTSSPVSEYEPEESLFNKMMDSEQDENILSPAVEISQEMICGVVGTNETDVEDKLYPDGEEMDTWDSVIEKKVDLKTDDGIKKDEEKRQHAEPEEDISAREQEHEKKEIRMDFAKDAQQDNIMASMMDTQGDEEGQHAALEQELVPFPDNKEEDDDDDDDDSQNVSVSWRTELESDSYALDNTLADTRPLIRYKSDEPDAKTQASHMEESESSEGEQEKRTGEMGMWSEGKSKRFGTMEDLCEEVEGEALDEEYNLKYSHIEDRDVDNGMTESDQDMLVNVEEMTTKVNEGHLDEETEELTKPMVPANVYSEELETDRLVEQELENLSTESYSAHFAQKLVHEEEDRLHLEMTEEEETEMSSFAEPEMRVNHQLASTTTPAQPDRNGYSSDLSVVMPQTDVMNTPEEREEEDEHNVSMVTALAVSQEHLIEQCQENPEAPGTTEWEVLENPNEDSEIRDQSEDGGDNVPESAESLHDDGRSDEVILTRKEEPLEISPDSVPTTTPDHPDRNGYSSDLSVVMPQTDTLADEEVQCKDQEVMDTPEAREEEDEHNESVVTHTDVIEDHSGFTDFMSRPDVEEINTSEHPNSVQITADQDAAAEVKEIVSVAAPSVSQEHLIEQCQENPEAPGTTEWEVLENPNEIRDQSEDGSDNVPESAESLHGDGGSDEGVLTCKEEPLEISPDSVPTTTPDQHDRKGYSSDLSVVIPQTDTLVDEEVQCKDQEMMDTLEEREEEDERNESMVTHADVKVDPDFMSRPDVEEINTSEHPNSVQITADQDVAAEVKEIVSAAAPAVSQEHLIEQCQENPEAPGTAEWEVLENPNEDSEIRDQSEDGGDNGPESAESLHDDVASDEGILTCKEDPLEISPDSVPDENDIFVVRDSAELLNTNGKDSSLHDLFSSGLKSDFWVSSLETGATFQPDDACNEAAQQTNQNLGFADNLVWGNSENVVNRNSRMDIESSKATKKEQDHMQSEVKQVFCRNVVEGELVHSDESDVEGESWSSGGEPV